MNATEEPATGVKRSTGRERLEWFAVLDEWGAVGRPYREIAEWLRTEHGLSNWWAQKLIVEYEQARGVRPPGVRAGGTFTVTVSKSVAVPVNRLYAAFADAEVRARWLPDLELNERTSQPGKSIRFDVGDGSARVNAGFTANGDARSSIGVEQERLADPAAAEEAKQFWKERLATLKTLLES